jgi:PAS domain S-box-containing protein
MAVSLASGNGLASAALTFAAGISGAIGLKRAKAAPAANELVEQAEKFAASLLKPAATPTSIEQSLRDAEARFLAFMDHSPFSAWMRDRSGQFVYCNERFAEHMGLQAHELMGTDQSASWFSREYVERSKRDDQRVLESGRSSENIEHVPLRDGSTRHWLVLKFPIQSHSGDAVVGAVALDLTGRYEAEEKLRDSEKRLRSIMQSAGEGIAVTDGEGKIISWNKAAETIFGRGADEAIGSALGEFLTPAGRREYAALLQGGTDEARPLLVQGLRKNGEEFPLEFSRSSWRSGAQTFYTKILRDVTERQRLAQEEQALLRASEAAALETSRLKSEFLAHMSHEIRTPINGVIGMSDLLVDTRLDQEQRSYADAIQRSAKGLLDIINDILDFSKIEAGKLEVEQIDFELARTFEDTEKMLLYLARGKGLELSLTIDADVPRELRGDPGRLRQVLGNLLSNAIKFTSKGGIQLRASREASAAGEAVRLRFEVTDTGIGIGPAALGRMFLPFSQADSSTSRQFGGTGLGLSICKRLVERMGGEIGVRSVEGRGSTFWFTMPFEASRAVHAVAGERDPRLSPSWDRSVRILVAEDNPINQTILLKLLEKNGLQAEAVGNGQEVLAALGERAYDLILMDCQMPGMDGYEATARIRALVEKSYCSIPIVAVTANAVKGDREKCLSLGMNDYVSKPVHPAELERVLRQWLKPSDPTAEGKAPPMEPKKPNAPAASSLVIELEMIEELRSLDDGEGEVLKQLIRERRSPQPQVERGQLRGAPRVGDLPEARAGQNSRSRGRSRASARAAACRIRQSERRAQGPLGVSPVLFPPILGPHVELVASSCPLDVAAKAEFEARGFTMPERLARAVSKRQEEFRAGRYCARKALEKRGCVLSLPLETLPDHSAAWPAGFVGSIAHSHDRAAAAVAKAAQVASVGIDMEPVLTEARAANVRRMILTAGDEGTVAALSGWSESERVTLVFSAKEAIYKCLRPLCGRYFGFEDASIDGVDEGAGIFRFHLHREIGGIFVAGWDGQGRFSREGGWIFAAMELAAPLGF